MTKVTLQLKTKDGATFIGEPTVFETTFVPRAGELIDIGGFRGLPDFVKDKSFLVESVVYRLTPHGFQPLITARDWYKGLRDELLGERGWIRPQGHENDYRHYDEDDAEHFSI